MEFWNTNWLWMSRSGILKDVLCPSSTVVKSRHNKKYLLNVTLRNSGIKFTPSIICRKKPTGRLTHFANLKLCKYLQQTSILDQFSATKPHAETLNFLLEFLKCFAEILSFCLDIWGLWCKFIKTHDWVLSMKIVWSFNSINAEGLNFSLSFEVFFKISKVEPMKCHQLTSIPGIYMRLHCH